MLGSMSEAEDAVQESWLRLSRSDTDSIENLGGWLTRVVARVCLDVLRSRNVRREEPLDTEEADTILSRDDGVDPEHEALMADAVGLALLVVLEKLAPPERLAFVLHDLFDVPFDEIAPIVGRSPTAARQLASRARRRVRGVSTVSDAEFTSQRSIVSAFLTASREGNFAELLAVLDPDVVLRADSVVIATGGASEVHGADKVASQFSGRARDARLALVDGAVGLVWAPGGQPRVAFAITVAGGKIVAIEMVGDPARLRALDSITLDG
jgi:RNA polymerase sigma-70 factor (ECF subfamily)